jgi:integrase
MSSPVICSIRSGCTSHGTRARRRLIAAGANAKVIQKVMGHATIPMTFDRYGHLMPGGLEEATAAADAYLARAV